MNELKLTTESPVIVLRTFLSGCGFSLLGSWVKSSCPSEVSRISKVGKSSLGVEGFNKIGRRSSPPAADSLTWTAEAEFACGWGTTRYLMPPMLMTDCASRGLNCLLTRIGGFLFFELVGVIVFEVVGWGEAADAAGDAEPAAEVTLTVVLEGRPEGE